MNRNLWYDLPNARCKMLYKWITKKKGEDADDDYDELNLFDF